MSDEHPGENWLHAEVFPCPSCQRTLLRIDHQRWATCSVLYCDQCANQAHVSHYVSATRALARQVQNVRARPPGWDEFAAFMRLLERRVKPCTCGGRYRYNAPRRCPYCLTPVLMDQPQVDVWPGYFWRGYFWDDYHQTGADPDPTDEQIEQARAYRAAHVRDRDLWRDGQGVVAAHT